jgi:hypothetical protein
MQSISSKWRPATIAFALALSTPLLKGRMPGQASSAQMITCRVIESKTAEGLRLRLVVFHHLQSADRDRLGALLRQHDGEDVDFRTPGGDWQAATVLRLRSCFGRGLLVLHAAQARLADGDEFVLRFGSLPPNARH